MTDDLQNIIQRTIKQVEDMGFTQIQLCNEAGLKQDLQIAIGWKEKN